MAEEKGVQRESRIIGGLFTIFIVGVLVRPVNSLLGPVGNDVTNEEIPTSTLMPILLWCVCWPFLVANRASAASRFVPLRGLRIFWVLGCVLLLLHIAIAFHLGHAWSHEAAWEHTRQVGGYGDGIYVNYTFAVVWAVDAIWLCGAFDSYFARPRWLNCTIHGFLAFVVLNATVVFGSWIARVEVVGFFAAALLLWYIQRRLATNPKAVRTPTRDHP